MGSRETHQSNPARALEADSRREYLESSYCIFFFLFRSLIRDWQVTYALEIVWAVALPFVKISILALYNRIFGNLVYMRRTNYALAIFTILWSITTALVCAFQCIPIRAAWYPIAAAHCINTRVFFFISSALDLVVWIAMLFLPMRAVWKLQKSFTDRLSLMLIFALGGL